MTPPKKGPGRSLPRRERGRDARRPAPARIDASRGTQHVVADLDGDGGPTPSPARSTRSAVRGTPRRTRPIRWTQATWVAVAVGAAGDRSPARPPRRRAAPVGPGAAAGVGGALLGRGAGSPTRLGRAVLGREALGRRSLGVGRMAVARRRRRACRPPARVFVAVVIAAGARRWPAVARRRGRARRTLRRRARVLVAARRLGTSSCSRSRTPASSSTSRSRTPSGSRRSCSRRTASRRSAPSPARSLAVRPPGRAAQDRVQRRPGRDRRCRRRARVRPRRPDAVPDRPTAWLLARPRAGAAFARQRGQRRARHRARRRPAVPDVLLGPGA